MIQPASNQSFEHALRRAFFEKGSLITATTASGDRADLARKLLEKILNANPDTTPRFWVTKAAALLAKARDQSRPPFPELVQGALLIWEKPPHERSTSPEEQAALIRIVHGYLVNVLLDHLTGEQEAGLSRTPSPTISARSRFDFGPISDGGVSIIQGIVAKTETAYLSDPTNVCVLADRFIEEIKYPILFTEMGLHLPDFGYVISANKAFLSGFEWDEAKLQNKNTTIRMLLGPTNAAVSMRILMSLSKTEQVVGPSKFQFRMGHTKNDVQFKPCIGTVVIRQFGKTLYGFIILSDLK